MRHVTPDTYVFTDYTKIELKQWSPFNISPMMGPAKNDIIAIVETWADVFIPGDDPHAIALGLGGERVRRKIEDIIRQFDGWKDHLVAPTVCPFVPKPMPFRFAIDVPTHYLNENAILVARVGAAEITQPNDPDNSSSGLKAPKHTELFPA
jgi:hypothetical protein